MPPGTVPALPTVTSVISSPVAGKAGGTTQALPAGQPGEGHASSDSAAFLSESWSAGLTAAVAALLNKLLYRQHKKFK